MMWWAFTKSKSVVLKGKHITEGFFCLFIFSFFNTVATYIPTQSLPNLSLIYLELILVFVLKQGFFKTSFFL